MKERYLPIDVFRGLTIFLMILVNTPGSWNYVYEPLKHAEWHGCTPTDLVFPFFLIAIGLSIAFSFKKFRSNKPKQLKKILKRSFIIFLIGVLLNWFPFYYKSFDQLRFLGVLQRIALAYLIAGIMITYCSRNLISILSVLILLGYWLLLFLLGGNDPYSLEQNGIGALDIFLFGSDHVYSGFGIDFDPEGILGSFPAAVSIAIAYKIGLYIQEAKNRILLPRDLVLIGLGFLILGMIWNQWLPINKPLWTGSYVVYTAGWAIIVLATLIWFIESRKWKFWVKPFQVFGLNPLFSYVLSIAVVKLMLYTFRINDMNLYAWSYEEYFQPLFGNYPGSFLFALTFTFIIWVFSLILYKKAIVIKI